jgi:hypothetical protein
MPRVFAYNCGQTKPAALCRHAARLVPECTFGGVFTDPADSRHVPFVKRPGAQALLAVLQSSDAVVLASATVFASFEESLLWLERWGRRRIGVYIARSKNFPDHRIFRSEDGPVYAAALPRALELCGDTLPFGLRHTTPAEASS